MGAYPKWIPCKCQKKGVPFLFAIYLEKERKYFSLKPDVSSLKDGRKTRSTYIKLNFEV